MMHSNFQEIRVGLLYILNDAPYNTELYEDNTDYLLDFIQRFFNVILPLTPSKSNLICDFGKRSNF